MQTPFQLDTFRCLGKGFPTLILSQVSILIGALRDPKEFKYLIFSTGYCQRQGRKSSTILTFLGERIFDVKSDRKRT
jgi:hypothetical protein